MLGKKILRFQGFLQENPMISAELVTSEPGTTVMCVSIMKDTNHVFKGGVNFPGNSKVKEKHPYRETKSKPNMRDYHEGLLLF